MLRSHVMRKPAFSIFENKGAHQLLDNRAADQRLRFRYIVQHICFLNPKIQASSHLLWLYSPDLSESPKKGFLVTRFIAHRIGDNRKRMRIKIRQLDIMLTCPCNVHPLSPHFYIVKLGFTGVYIIFLIFALNHKLWVLNVYPRSMF